LAFLLACNLQEQEPLDRSLTIDSLLGSPGSLQSKGSVMDRMSREQKLQYFGELYIRQILHNRHQRERARAIVRLFEESTGEKTVEELRERLHRQFEGSENYSLQFEQELNKARF